MDRKRLEFGLLDRKQCIHNLLRECDQHFVCASCLFHRLELLQEVAVLRDGAIEAGHLVLQAPSI